MHGHIIKKPLLTEKTGEGLASNKYTFQVNIKANKSQIKREVEKFFNVRVTKVNTLIQCGKVKRVRKIAGKRPDWKKAIVTLASGDKIPFFEGI